MKMFYIRMFLLITLFVGVGDTLSCFSQTKKVTYYGKTTSYTNGTTLQSTLQKSIQVIYDDDTPISIIRGGLILDLSLEECEEDCNLYSVDENSSLMFKIYDNKKLVAELYFSLYGNLQYVSFYDRIAPSSNKKNYRGNGESSGGIFVMPDNSGSSSSSGSIYRTCPSCGGSGTCSSCHGSGGEWRDTGYYTGSGAKSWISCPSCSGSKRCFNCHGSGKI